MKRNWDYEQLVKANHNEVVSLTNVETGEIREVKKKLNKIPKGKSKLDYKRYHISNDFFAHTMLSNNVLTNEDLGVITHMSSMAEINTNSLRPLTDETTMRELAERFFLDRRRVDKIFKKLFTLGVYMQMNYFSDSEQREVTYWVLNPYISWKGNLKTDSIFAAFADTTIVRLLK